MKTSLTHPLKIASVACGAGRVGLGPCPGKYQPLSRSGPWDRCLATDLDAVRAWGARTVLTLLEWHEMRALDVDALPLQCAAHGMVWLWAPIADGWAPSDDFDAQWRQHGPQLRALLASGGRVYVHCMGGLGRAGTVAAELLRAVDELPPILAIDVVRGARPGAVETPEQERWLKRRRRRRLTL